MLSKFRYQPRAAVSGNLGGKIQLVDNVLASHEQEFCPTTSSDEFCIEIEFQTDGNDYVVLRQIFLALKLQLVNCRSYETYNTKENLLGKIQKKLGQKVPWSARQRKRKMYQFFWLPL